MHQSETNVAESEDNQVEALLFGFRIVMSHVKSPISGWGRVEAKADATA